MLLLFDRWGHIGPHRGIHTHTGACLLFKARKPASPGQLPLMFGQRKEVQAPGSRGSTKWHRTPEGKVVYGEQGAGQTPKKLPEAASWHTKTPGHASCPTCGAKVRAGVKHRQLDETERGSWGSATHIKRIKVGFGQDFSDEPISAGEPKPADKPPTFSIESPVGGKVGRFEVEAGFAPEATKQAVKRDPDWMTSDPELAARRAQIKKDLQAVSKKTREQVAAERAAHEQKAREGKEPTTRGPLSRDVSPTTLEGLASQGRAIYPDIPNANRMEILTHPHVYKVWRKLNPGWHVERVYHPKWGWGYQVYNETGVKDKQGNVVRSYWNRPKDDYFGHSPSTAWNGVTRNTIHQFIDDLAAMAGGHRGDEGEPMARAKKAGLKIKYGEGGAPLIADQVRVGDVLVHYHPNPNRTVRMVRRRVVSVGRHPLQRDISFELDDGSKILAGPNDRLAIAAPGEGPTPTNGATKAILWLKAHVRAFQRRGPGGQMEEVSEHEDQRPSAQPTIPTAPRPAAQPPVAHGRAPASEQPPGGQPAPQAAEERVPVRASDISHEEIGQHIAQFVPVLTKAVDQLTELFPGLPVGGRLKETASLVEKLSRQQKPIEEIADIAGARITLDNADDQKLAVERIRRSFQVRDEDDYLTQPKASYRSHHFIAEVDGKPVEIQVRTARQTRWADFAHDTAYKAHGQTPPPELHQYLAEMSNYYACLDGGGMKCGQMPECVPVVAQAYGCLNGEEKHGDAQPGLGAKDQEAQPQGSNRGGRP